MMTSTEANFASKRVNETSKKSPLKVVSPIIKKYSGQRQGRIKKKLKFPRGIPGGRSKGNKQTKPSLKTILPKTNAGDVIILEPELIPCALNLQSKASREEELDNGVEDTSKTLTTNDEKAVKCSVTKESRVNKTKLNSSNKRKKYLKNLEATFSLLKPEPEAVRDKREQAFAENYLQRVQQKLRGKDNNLYGQFIDLISDFQKRGIPVVDLYKKVRQMFVNHVDLGEEFIAFLTPKQAVECGVFLEHLLLTTMSDFLRMIEVYFSKSPQQIKRIHSVLEALSLRQSLSTEDVTNAVLPLLKGNTFLQDYFLRLLPHGTPPSSFLMDFEEVEYPELNSDLSEDEEHYELVKVPDVEDVFGGDGCPCNCHNSEDDKFKTRILHCTSCSIKFINGKIFIQNGKLLRPAKVTFVDHDTAYHRDRLTPKLYPKRVRKKSKVSIFKENLSPTKSCYLSSDEFKSDIEDDERIKSKLGLTRSPRTISKKMFSPKNCERGLPRSIFSDAKSDCVESDDKRSVLDVNDSRVVSGVDAEVETPRKALDLPQIDSEELTVIPKEEEEVGSILVSKEGSKSPPVISIPDTANPPLFPSGKPILSFLENLDSSKEPTLLISNDVESFPEVLKSEVKEEKAQEEEMSPWKIEEDRIILQTLQVEENCEETFRKINDKIPSRSLKDIKERFATLMKILYEMKAKNIKKEDDSTNG